ncbi:hypothetical protein BC829DRAFT_467676, partial [Chytridium lagenaria]
CTSYLLSEEALNAKLAARIFLGTINSNTTLRSSSSSVRRATPTTNRASIMPGGGTFIPTSSNPTGPGDEQATKPLPLWQILLLTASLGGIQFAWTVEFAYGTPYLQSLGMPKPLLALVWLAGPLSGLCIQPLVGVYSDRCTMSWGRRRPFLIGGAFIMVLSVIMVAYSKSRCKMYSGYYVLIFHSLRL